MFSFYFVIMTFKPMHEKLIFIYLYNIQCTVGTGYMLIAGLQTFARSLIIILFKYITKLQW